MVELSCRARTQTSEVLTWILSGNCRRIPSYGNGIRMVTRKLVTHLKSVGFALLSKNQVQMQSKILF